MELVFGVVGQWGSHHPWDLLLVIPGKLVNKCSWVSCSSLFLCQLVGPSGSYHHYSMWGGLLPPHHPKDRDTPELPWPGRGCRLQEDRSCGLWENLRW